MPLIRLQTFAVAAQVLVEGNANVRLSNITVDGANNNITTSGLDLRGIYYLNASGQIQNVATRNQILPPGFTGCRSGQGIFVQAGYGMPLSQSVNIQNNSVHSFEKNGITADGNTLQVQIQNNSIVGQGLTTGAAENGIQISAGAQGHILQNIISDEIWAPDTSSDRGDAGQRNHHRGIAECRGCDQHHQFHSVRHSCGNQFRIRHPRQSQWPFG
jgi:hypothetical protein